MLPGDAKGVNDAVEKDADRLLANHGHTEHPAEEGRRHPAPRRVDPKVRVGPEGSMAWCHAFTGRLNGFLVPVPANSNPFVTLCRGSVIKHNTVERYLNEADTTGMFCILEVSGLTMQIRGTWENPP